MKSKKSKNLKKKQQRAYQNEKKIQKKIENLNKENNIKINEELQDKKIEVFKDVNKKSKIKTTENKSKICESQKEEEKNISKQNNRQKEIKKTNSKNANNEKKTEKKKDIKNEKLKIKKDKKSEKNEVIKSETKEIKQKPKRSYKKVFIVVAIILILIILMLFIAAVEYIKDKFSRTNYLSLNEENLGINSNLYNEVSENISIEEFNDIKTIALFGADSRDTDDSYNDSRSDSLMIASINPNTKSIKLVSIPRDTYVDVPGHGKTKINHAFAYGKEELSIKTINQNFGLNISEFITIDFSGLVEVIDSLGGIDIEISKEEMEFINKAIWYTAEVSNGDDTKLNSYGLVHLNGTQALTHCRNRYVGNNDFRRTERQREVLSIIIRDILSKDIKEINELINKFLPCITSNIDIKDAIKYIPFILNYKNEYSKNITSAQVPALEYSAGKMIDGVYYYTTDMEKAINDMKNILYKEQTAGEENTNKVNANIVESNKVNTNKTDSN